MKLFMIMYLLSMSGATVITAGGTVALGQGS